MTIFSVIYLVFPVGLANYSPNESLGEKSDHSEARWQRLVLEADQNIPKLLQIIPLATPVQGSALRKKISTLLASLPPQKKDLLLADKQFRQILRQTLHNPEQACQLFGKPDLINRQVLYRHYLEQQVYEEPWFLVFVWDFPRGENPRLLEVAVWKK